MAYIGFTEKFEDKALSIYKYVDVQSGDVEYTFWEDKYEEEVYFGRKTVQELVVGDFCVQEIVVVGFCAEEHI